jgi:hypothetical protein
MGVDPLHNQHTIGVLLALLKMVHAWTLKQSMALACWTTLPAQLQIQISDCFHGVAEGDEFLCSDEQKLER